MAYLEVGHSEMPHPLASHTLILVRKIYRQNAWTSGSSRSVYRNINYKTHHFHPEIWKKFAPTPSALRCLELLPRSKILNTPLFHDIKYREPHAGLRSTQRKRSCRFCGPNKRRHDLAKVRRPLKHTNYYITFWMQKLTSSDEKFTCCRETT